MLTASADTGSKFVGTEKGDVFKADSFVSATGTYLPTLNSSDELDGGAGKDTLNITDETATGYTMATASIKNIETITIKGADDVLANVAGSNVTGLETISVLKSVDAEVHANSTTDVNVSAATGTIEVSGGKNVVVNDSTGDKVITIGQTSAIGSVPGDVTETNAAGTITVTDTKLNDGNIVINGGTDVTVTATSDKTNTVNGTDGIIEIGTATQATGDVVVIKNLNSDGVAAFAADVVKVTGGKTVTVTHNATTTAKTNTSDNDITIGDTLVIGDSKTTDVTVTQNKSVTTKTADTVAQVNAKSVVTFVAMAKGETTTVNGLVFTASKALTAAEVASAFANLTLNDTQTPSGPTANGYFTGTSNTKAWTSGAASGATVTFTNADAAQVGAATTTHKLDVSDTAAAGTVAAVTTNGAIATGGDFATNDVAYGTVNIKDNATAAIKTVTIDGFASATIGIDAAAADSKLDALTTLNIANNTANGNVTVATDATKLALGVNNITGTSVVNLDHNGLTTGAVVDGSKTITDLTINATGKKSNFEIQTDALKNLTINADVALDISSNAPTSYANVALKTVDVNGAGAVNLGILTTAKLNTFDASGNTGGVTATIDTATASVDKITEYIFSAGNDVVTLDETAVNTKITLGAGDDKINLKATTTSLANTIDGGTGTNTIHMNSADANKATGATNSSAFEGKISNFQKLSLAKVLTGAKDTIDLANMDDISYVISAGTADTVETTVLTTVSTAADLTTSGSISLVVGGVTYTVNDGETVNAVEVVGTATALTALAYKIQQDGRVNTAVATVADNATLTITSKAGNALQVGTLTSTLNATTPITTATNVATGSLLTLENMANNGTLELTGTATGTVVTMTDATGTADTFNILIGDNAGNVGTVIVKGVETVKVTTTNTFVDVSGGFDGNGIAIADGKDESASAATLTVTSDKTKTVDVSGAGDLSLITASSVLTKVDASAMTGALTYTASVNSVVVTGGTAVDVLTANADDVRLNGGAGNDTLTVNTGADRAILDGGAGADKFVIAGAASTSSTYANILNVNSGDTIKFTGADSFVATKVTLSVGATETTQALMDLAVNNLAANQMGWFQTGGNTFIVMDAGTNGTTGFVDGQDMVVMITGLVDLSTASFNVNGTLEIA